MKKIICLTMVAFSLVFGLSQAVFGIGQMTKPIEIRDILRGQEFTNTLTLLNSKDKKVVYDLEAIGEIENWAAFYKIEDKDLKNPIDEIQIPPKSYLDAIVKFTIPKDTPNGRYLGEVEIISVPDEDSKNKATTATVFQKVGRKVSITVTDKENINFKTAVIPEKYDIKRGELLKIKVIYDNRGNVLIRPDFQLKITKGGSAVFDAIFPYPEGENPVKPFNIKEFPSLVKWETAGQEVGKYKAEIEILLNGKVIEEEDFRFNIKSANKLLAAVAFLGGGNITLGWFVAGSFFLLIAAASVFINKKPKLLKVAKQKIKKIYKKP